MPRGFAMDKLSILALLLGSIAFADPGNTQPAGGDVTGPATGGTSTGGTSTGGNVTGGPTTGGATTGNNPSGGNTGGGVTGGNVTGGNVGVNVGEERRFQVQLLQFKVIDETGADWLGSDEVSFVIKTPNYALFSSEYSVDSRDDPYRLERCVFPAVDGDNERDREWECEPRGMAPHFPLRLPPTKMTSYFKATTAFAYQPQRFCPTGGLPTYILRERLT
jgi:hypothetical protein